jgi:hypothetical protein
MSGTWVHKDGTDCGHGIDPDTAEEEAEQDMLLTTQTMPPRRYLCRAGLVLGAYRETQADPPPAGYPGAVRLEGDNIVKPWRYR